MSVQVGDEGSRQRDKLREELTLAKIELHTEVVDERDGWLPQLEALRPAVCWSEVVTP